MAEAVGAKEHGAEAVQGRALAFTLYALVFCTGAAALATEIGAARLLAPYYGSSTIVWANVIGLVLASLSVGYWVGGKIADRSPSPRVLGRIVVFAAVLIAIIPFAAGPFLDVSVRGLDQVSAGAAIGSFFAVLALFAPALTLLGMVAPFAIRLAIDDVREAGSVAGRLYALSTVGSLLGTFLAALVLIPTIGTRRTLLAAALLVALSGAALLGRRWLLVAAGVGVLIVIPAGAVRAEPGLIYEHESRYQFIHVTDLNGVRRLYLNEGLAVHSLWRPNTVLTGGEWDTYLAVPPLLGRPLRRVAILGNAGGTTARAMGVFYPQARIDGVELDPDVTAVGRRYFGLDDNPRLHVITADARPFLRRTHDTYDLIIVDAYRPPYVPFYLATQEFFRLARSRLAPGGAIVLNVGSTPGRPPPRRGRLRDPRDGVPARPHLAGAALQPVRDRARPSRAAGRARAPAERRAPAAAIVDEPARRPDAYRGSVIRSVDGRSRAGRVDHRPDDPRVRGSRRPVRGVPAADRALRLLRGDGPLLRIGHRGAAGLAPENTIEAVEAALEHGVDHVELDVFAGRDGKLVLGHSRRELADEPVALDEMLAFLAERAPETGVLVDLKFAGKERSSSRRSEPTASSSGRSPARARWTRSGT